MKYFFHILLALTTTTLSLSAKASDLAPKKLLLAVGVSDFQSGVWHPLKYAAKDASDIYSHFLGKNGSFDGGQLLNTSIVRKDDIERALKRLETENHNFLYAHSAHPCFSQQALATTLS